jgi:hypothetical protein
MPRGILFSGRDLFVGDDKTTERGFTQDTIFIHMLLVVWYDTVMKRRVGFWAVGVLSISLLCGILLGGGVAHAQSGGGGVGSGGTGSGGSGGAQTQYGWGWRIYPVGAATTGPTGGFRDGSTWNQVGGPNRSCTGYSTGVAMFTINNNDSPKKQVVYSFTDNGPPNPFYGQSVTNSPAPPHYTGLYDRDQGGPMTYLAYIYRGGSYISVKQALVAYNALPASIKVGHTFGTNVGWFCYGILPQDAAPTNTFSVSCTTLTGYATDADRPNNALSVEIYMDGTAAGNRIATVTTSTSSNPRGLYTLNITNRVLLASHNFYTIVRGLTPI